MQVLCQEVKFSRGTGAAEGRWTLNKAAGEKTLIGDKCDAREWSLSCTGKHLNGEFSRRVDTADRTLSSTPQDTLGSASHLGALRRRSTVARLTKALAERFLRGHLT